MIQFTIGLALFAFAAILGTFKSFENVDKIQVTQNSLQSSMRDRDRILKIQTDIQKAVRETLEAGQDQKNNIERLFNLAERDLEFSFIGQPTQNPAAPGIFYHTYRITGIETYSKISELLTLIASTPGFSVYKTCFNCSRVSRELKPGHHMITIEGHLYVHNPRQI
ncbi:MAG: hypothetical protein OSB62_00330 [Alphaproteobacteria bacterium]|nr:hypothetical protein [Alphaproteobacteria bacterium]